MSDRQDIIAFQLLVAQKRGLGTVRLSGASTVTDENGTPVIDLDEHLTHLASRLKAFADSSEIGLRATLAQVALLESEGELALAQTWGVDLDLLKLLPNSKSLGLAALEAWKARTLAAVTANMTGSSPPPSCAAALGTVIEHIAAELEEGGELHRLEPIPGLKLEGVREKWVDVELSSLESRSEIFHTPGGRTGKRLPVSLFMDGFANAAAIFGGPGAGKTTLLKWIASEAVLGRYHSFRLPIYVRLREYAEHYRETPLTVFRFALTRYGLPDPGQDIEKFLERLSQQSRNRQGGYGGILFLLDGWDEVPPDQRLEIGRQIQRTMVTAPCLVTSRPGEMYGLPVVHLVRIAPLSPKLMHRLITAWLPAARAQVVMEHLDQHPELEALSQNPFILTALCGLANLETNASRRTLPRDRRDLFDGIVQAICDHFNEENAPARLEDQIQLCERLAFYTLADARGAPRLDFGSYDVEAVGGTADLFDKTVVRSRLVVRSKIIPPSYGFLHATIHEFLVARHLKDSSNLKRLRSLTQAFLHSPRWSGVFHFLTDQLTNDHAGARRVFVDALREALAKRDRFGVIECCVADYLAALRHSGDTTLIAEDLAKQLWLSVERWPDFIEGIEALTRLAPTYFLEKAIALEKNDAKEDNEGKNRKQGQLSPVAEQLYQFTNVKSKLARRVFFVGGPEVNSELYRRLPKLSRQHQLKCIALLGESGDDDAAIGLDRFFWHADSQEARLAVVSALRRMGCQEARDALLSIVAARAGHPEGDLALNALAAYPCPCGVEMLLDIVNDKSSRLENRVNAAAALGATAEPGVIDLVAVIASSQNHPSAIRVTCLDALAGHGNPSHLTALLASAKKRELGKHTSRVTAAIVGIGSRSADTAIFRKVHDVLAEMASDFLSDPDPTIRAHAIRAAGLAGGRFIDDLIAIVRDRSASSDDRSVAAFALADADSSQGVDALLELVRDARDRIRKRGNGDFGHAGVAALLRLAPRRLTEYDSPEFETTIARWAQANNALVFESHIVMPFESRTDRSSIGVPGDVPAQASSKGGEDTPTKQKPKGRGRPSIDSHDPERDQQIADAWATNTYEDYADLGRVFRMSRRQIERLMNRVQKRNQRQG